MAEFQMTTSRLLTRESKEAKESKPDDSKPPKNYLHQLCLLILPPFITSILSFLAKVITRLLSYLHPKQSGESSLEFHKRRFEEDIQDLTLEQEDLGFTNQILVQEGRKTTTLFLPVYVACKIKSIQDVSVQSLTGNISCALIISISYADLPEELISKLENSVVLQLNRGEPMILTDDGLNITCKRNEKARFLVFTLRKVFLALMIEDTLWSPFELLQLVISITLNTVTVAPYSLTPELINTGFNPKREYKISFNCMRNSDLMPLSFALDCVYGVYDLAERKLQSYHSKFSTYKEVQKHHEDLQNEKKQGKKKKDSKKEKKGKKDSERDKEHQKGSLKGEDESNNFATFLLKEIAQTTVRRLSMRTQGIDIKSPPKKVKYFQYTHLIIPLYKYPGNALITIFLPVLLLAMLSLAIFFQESELSGRIGSIATMFLGYIALVPSIKEQLPPSAQLTVIEALVYIETLCCMLCLYESFMIREIVDYQFIWSQNSTFLCCLSIHSAVFMFVLGLYWMHKLRWEPGYNCDEKIAEVKPVDNSISWDNPYCDQVFIKFNQDVQANSRNKQEMLIRPYLNATLGKTEKEIERIEAKQGDIDTMGAEAKDVEDKGVVAEEEISLSYFEDVPPRQTVLKKALQIDCKRTVKDLIGEGRSLTDANSILMDQKSGALMWSMSPRSRSEFVPPDESLYYSKKD